MLDQRLNYMYMYAYFEYSPIRHLFCKLYEYSSLYVIKASYFIELCFSVNNTLCSFGGDVLYVKVCQFHLRSLKVVLDVSMSIAEGALHLVTYNSIYMW